MNRNKLGWQRYLCLVEYVLFSMVVLAVVGKELHLLKKPVLYSYSSISLVLQTWPLFYD